MILAGIDYGSKMAGTTVLCVYSATTTPLQWYTSAKNQDADEFLMEHLMELRPDLVMLDAPLSLPGIYKQPDQYSDYFYRKCDRILQGMSPMFLGGLTARAIKLKDQLAEAKIRCQETYPACQASRLELVDLGYKHQTSSIRPVLDKILDIAPVTTEPGELTSWHHIDALLALMAAINFKNHKSQLVGDPNEGVIYL
jgi:uncharacterized protein